MNRIGLLAALKLQIPRIIPCEKSDDVQVHQIGEREIGVLVTGIGQENSRDSFHRLYRGFHPNYLILTGFCGGTRDDLFVGDLVVPRNVHYNGNQVELQNQQLEEVLNFLSRGSMRYRAGDMLTSDKPVFSRQEVIESVVGVDMEAYAVTKASQIYGLPLVIVKAVSDIVPLTQGNPCSNPRDNIRTAKGSLDKFFGEYFQRE